MTIRRIVTLIFILGITCQAWAQQSGPVATITSGKIRGRMDNGINAFRGIPYGEDTAKHRFKPSVPPRPWSDVRDAIDYAKMAPQNGGGGGGRGGAGANAASEDCLYLNVWTPGLRDGRKRAVMVYFHGGAYNNGTVTTPLYDGTRLSKRGDVVVVTVNHRLNGFGYLYLAELCGKEYAESGNVGQLDLVLALQWVHDNITEFGGDPGNVMIFGQSGGGAKCSTLMAMPSARGLFHRVVTMSGQQITGRTREHATADAKNVLTNLNITPEQIARIDTFTTDQISAAFRGGNWNPVVDGTVLPRDPFAPDASPLSADIPMMKGNTRQETAAFFAGAADDSTKWEQVPELITRNVAQYLGDLKPEAIVAQYRQWYPDYSPADVFYEATTAARSWKSMVVEVESRAKQNKAPLFVYQLDWHAPGGRAGHTNDIPLALDTVSAGARGAPSADAQKMADLMSESFIAFAKSGNPDTPALPHWPRYEMDKRATMVFDLPSKVENDPRGNERKLFAPIVYVQPGT